MITDRTLHIVLIIVGLGVGSFVKTFWDKLAEHFWDAEWKEFKKWQEATKKG